MPGNSVTSTREVTKFYTIVYLSTHSTTDNKRMQSRSFPPTKPSELRSSMVSSDLPEGSFGVLLPICLLAVFLSCVVCVYHWQGTAERRLDMEDDRKRKRALSEFDSGCALRTYKPLNKTKLRSYPWKSTRIHNLPDINNNDCFDIPIFSGMTYGPARYYGDSSRPSAAMAHTSVHHEWPILKSFPIRDKTGCTTVDLSGLSFSASDIDVSLNLSADTTTESCAAILASTTEKQNPGVNSLKDETGCDVSLEDLTYVIHHNVDGEVVSVQTTNGSLVEYWV